MEDIRIIECEDFVRGDSLPLTFPITDANDTSIEMTDIETLFLTCRELPHLESPIIFEKNIDDFRYEDGEYKVEIEPAETEELTRIDQLFFDIEVTLKSGQRKTIICCIEMKKDYTIHGGVADGD